MGAGSRGGLDALDEALPVDADQPPGDRDDGSGAAVVGGQLNAPRAGVERLEAQDPTHVGEPPGVDGLVVIAHHEQVALRLGQQSHQAQLCRIHVLELVHAQVRETVLPAQAEARVRLHRIGRPDHQVVEVDRSDRGEHCPIGFHQLGAIRRAPLDLPGGNLGIQRRGVRQWRIVRGHGRGCPAQDGAQQGQPVAHQLGAAASVEHHLAGQRVQGPHLDSAGGGDGWRQPRLDAR